jgi:hypothetical protein
MGTLDTRFHKVKGRALTWVDWDAEGDMEPLNALLLLFVERLTADDSFTVQESEILRGARYFLAGLRFARGSKKPSLKTPPSADRSLPCEP